MKRLFLTLSALLFAAAVTMCVAAPVDNDDVEMEKSGVTDVEAIVASPTVAATAAADDDDDDDGDDDEADVEEDVNDDDGFAMKQLLKNLLERQGVSSVTRTDEFLEFVVPLEGTSRPGASHGNSESEDDRGLSLQLGNLFKEGLLSRKRRRTYRTIDTLNNNRNYGKPIRDGWSRNGYTWGNGRYNVYPIYNFGSHTYGLGFRIRF